MLEKGSNRIPETTQEAQKEVRDGTQKRASGSLEEVMSPIIRGDLLRLGRFSRRGSAPPTLESPIIRGDLLPLGSCLELDRRPFVANRGLALEMCAHFQKGSVSSFWPVFTKYSGRRDENHFAGPWASLLVALGPPLGGSRGAEGGHVESRSCFSVWGAYPPHTTARAGAKHH